MIKFQEFKSKLSRYFAKKSFRFMEKYFDLHVTMNDYYSPIPSLKDLPSSVYEQQFSMRGVDLNEAAQNDLLDGALAFYQSEFRPEKNEGLSLVDAAILYSMIRLHKPKKMIEVGGGYSTLITLEALARNKEEGVECQFICIEPYPRKFLIDASRNGDFHLLEKQVQDVEISCFEDIDILFIDS